MLCEHCKKREATVKYVEVINGVKTEHNLCAQCASHIDMGQYSALFEGEFPLGKLLSGLLGMQETDRTSERFSGVVCPTCGTTYEEFVKNSQFGCPDCYSVFDPLIAENIRHLQGSEKHVGKRPTDWKRPLAGEAETARETEDPLKEDGASQETPEPSENEAASSGAQAALTAKERVRLLQARLKDAVKREEYEEAASLRDEIHKLEEEISKHE